MFQLPIPVVYPKEWRARVQGTNATSSPDATQKVQKPFFVTKKNFFPAAWAASPYPQLTSSPY